MTMTDVHEPEVRSYNMSQIRSKDTKPELVVRKFLFKNGFRYRLHVKDLPGKPDIVLAKYRTVIFVNGCFWQGHEGCRYFVVPKTRTECWVNKIVQNKLLDSDNYIKLNSLGWKVITIFEYRLRKEFREGTLNELITNISERLQSFPVDYYFEGVKELSNRTAAFKQIGNAVPPLIAKAA